MVKTVTISAIVCAAAVLWTACGGERTAPEGPATAGPAIDTTGMGLPGDPLLGATMGTAGAGTLPTTPVPGTNDPQAPVVAPTVAMGGAPNLDSNYEPWPGYWEEYPSKYHYMMYDPAKHPGAVGTTEEQGAAGGVSAPDDPAEHDCALNPPTEMQIREANDIAVRTAMFLETLPVFTDKNEADLYRADYGMGTAFGIPGLDSLWDTAGWHYIYDAGTGDGQEVVPERPEIINYIQTNDGFRPIGVMLMAEGAGPGPDYGGCLTFWHLHDAFGPIGAALGYMLHIYVYGNPIGPYNEPEGCTARNYPDCINATPNPLDFPVHGQ